MRQQESGEGERERKRENKTGKSEKERGYTERGKWQLRMRERGGQGKLEKSEACADPEG